MNLSPQLLTPCQWTVHPHEGGWPVCRGSWSVGVGRSNPRTVFGGAGGVQRDQQPTTITLTVLTEAVNFEFGKFHSRID